MSACQIAAKMWVNTLSASVTSLSVVKIGRWLWELLINLFKSKILQRWGKWKTYLESIRVTGSPPKV